MKKASLYRSPALLAMLGCLLAPGQGTAAPLVTDSFATTSDGSGGTYTTSTTDARIYGQNPSAFNSGFDTAWSNSNALTTSGLRVETSGLTHSLLQGTAVAGDVYAVKNSLGRSVTRGFASSVDTAIANQESTDGEIWFSGLTSTVGTNSGGFFFGLGANIGSGTAPTSGIQVYTGNGQIRLYNGAAQLGTGFSITSGVTYLVAVRIDFSAGATDAVTLNIYNASATSGTPTATISGSNLNITAADLAYLVLHQSNTSAYSTDATTPRYDEFRLGLQQSDVVAVPEPSSLALIGLGLATILYRWPRRRSV